MGTSDCRQRAFRTFEIPFVFFSLYPECQNWLPFRGRTTEPPRFVPHCGVSVRSFFRRSVANFAHSGLEINQIITIY
jgi:hypothetical protein